jgi:hypothetical protein
LGEDGLTAHQIAESLGIKAKHVHEKLRRNEWQHKKVPNWRVAVYTAANDSNGLGIESFALNTRAAKAFVARWANEIGDAYLDFLFECERLALEEVPRLRAEIESIKARHSRPRTWLVSKVEESVLDGFPLVPVLRSVEESTLTPAELQAAKNEHVIRTINGIIKKHVAPAKPEDKLAMAILMMKELINP